MSNIYNLFHKKMIKRNFLKVPNLRNIFIVTTILLFIVVTYFVKYNFPTVHNTLVNMAKEDSIRAGNYLSSTILSDCCKVINADSFNDGFKQNVKKVIRDLEIMKIKIFDINGKIVFSTESKDIGEINTKDYFRNIVSKGNVFATYVQKDSYSMEGHKIKIDVVETYVPMMAHKDSFCGAFEIYYNISHRKKQLDDFLFQTSFFVWGLSILIWFAVIFILYLENISFLRRNLEKIKREKLIEKLQNAIQQIKVASGLIPICAYCRKVRDDEGYWNRIEMFRKQSKTEFTHGICPTCLKKELDSNK